MSTRVTTHTTNAPNISTSLFDRDTRDVAVLTFEVGEAELLIHFRDTKVFLDFCKKHNFKVIDERVKAPKQFDFSIPMCCPPDLVGVDVAYWHKGCEAFQKYVVHGFRIRREIHPAERLEAFNRGVADIEREFNKFSNAETVAEDAK